MSAKIASELTWSFAGPWYWEYCNWKDGKYNDLWSKTEFMIDRNFKVLPVDFAQLDELSEEELDSLYTKISEAQVTYRPHVSMDWTVATPQSAQKYAEKWMEAAKKYQRFFGYKLATTCLHPTHRFSREMSLHDKINHFSEILKPIALACHTAGYSFAVENHGDYYISDFVKICAITPYMGIFFDTGNCFLIGEKPLEAAREAAPFIYGVHLKDHCITINEGDLRLELDGAALGQGDVGLKEIFDIIMKNSSNPDKILMEIELVKPKDSDTNQILDQSLAFVNTLNRKKGE